MKRALCRKASALLAALLLAGCAATPANPVQTEETAEATPAPAAEEAEKTAAAPTLRELTTVADGRCYLQSRIDDTAQIYLTTLDLTDGQQRVLCAKPGCTHSDESCWGRMLGNGVAQPKTVEVYTDGVRLYWILLTEYSHFSIGGVEPESAIFVTDLTGASCPPAQMLAGTPNYGGDFLQDNSYMDSRWFTDGETLWALVNSNPVEETGRQTMTTTLFHFVPAPAGSEVPYTARVVWQQGGDHGIDCMGLLDGQILLRLPVSCAGVGDFELRLLSADGTLGEPLLTYRDSDFREAVLLDGLWYTVPKDSTDLQCTDLRAGQTRTLCTLPLTQTPLDIQAGPAYEGRLVVDVSYNLEKERYVIDTVTGSVTTLPATWTKDGVSPRAPLIRQVAGDRCLMMVGDQDRMLTTMGQDGGTYSFNSPVPIWAVTDFGAYLDGDQDWTVCTVLDPDGNM